MQYRILIEYELDAYMHRLAWPRLVGETEDGFNLILCQVPILLVRTLGKELGVRTCIFIFIHS